MRKRGFGLSRPVLCIALILTLVIGCIPHDDPITSAKAEALVPVAVGVGAAAATAMGITETELVLGIMAALGAGVAMQVSFNDMYECIDSQTGQIDLEDYQTNYVDWRSKGVNVPNWGDLDASTRAQWGDWAWHYDEAVWLGYYMKFVGLSGSSGPDDPNNSPEDNKKWNLIKALAKGGAVVAAAELGTMAIDNFVNNLFSPGIESSVGMFAWNEAMYNGKELPFLNFAAEGIPESYAPRGIIAYDSWPIGCATTVYEGAQAYDINIVYYFEYREDSYEPVALNYDVREQNNAWYYIGRSNPQNWVSGAVYNTSTGEIYKSSSSVVQGNGTYKLGHNIQYNGGNIYTDRIYFLNPNYVGGYRFADSNGVDISPTRQDNIQYGQYSDYPQEQAENMFFNDPEAWADFWQNLQSQDPEKTVTIVNPYYKGELNPTWEDYISERNTQDVYPLPDDQPNTDPYPTPDPENPENPDPENPENPDYDTRLRRIADLAFSQAFPFCLINDIKMLSDRFVEAGSANPDFSVDIPLEDFGIEGVEVLTLDANHPSTGGGLLELGDYTRPLVTIVFIALLLGFSIKLFLR